VCRNQEVCKHQVLCRNQVVCTHQMWVSISPRFLDGLYQDDPLNLHLVGLLDVSKMNPRTSNGLPNLMSRGVGVVQTTGMLWIFILLAGVVWVSVQIFSLFKVLLG
jgi:hypothetical protein